MGLSIMRKRFRQHPVKRTKLGEGEWLIQNSRTVLNCACGKPVRDFIRTVYHWDPYDETSHEGVNHECVVCYNKVSEDCGLRPLELIPFPVK